VFLQVADQRRAEVAIGLLARIDREILPEHLERVLIKLTNAQATGVLGMSVDPLIEQLSAELDGARRVAGGLRGDARRSMSERLAAADRSLLALVRQAMTAEDLQALRLSVDGLLGSAVDQMAPLAADDPKFIEGAVKAMEIYWKDQIDIPIIQWLHRIPYNQTYWTNWPTKANLAAGTNGAFWAHTGLLVITQLKPAQ